MKSPDAIHSRPSRSSWRGFIAHVAFALWFLLTALVARSAYAQEAQTVTAADILPSIEAALMAKGVSAAAEITLADPSAPVAVAGGEPQIDYVSVNPATGRFLVRVNGAAIGGFAKVAARYPVLVQPLARGETVASANIDWIETADAGAGTITDAGDLVGMEARRPLAAGAPLRKSDVAAPVLVKRGALITMTYAVAGLALTESGIAQATGGKGDVVEVKNVKSERIIRAVIDGKDRVRVISSRMAARQ